MPVDTNRSLPMASANTAGIQRLRRMIVATISMVIVLGAGTVLAGKIYKWTDAQGNVHYGSEKPVDAAAEKMKVDTGKTGVNRGAKALDDLKQAEDDEAQRIKEQGIPAQPPVPSLSMKEVKRRCQTARQDLATIQSRGQLRERDAQGNTRYVGEKERQQRIKAAQKQVREYCN